MFTILGSGFGLYGYLPALMREAGEQVTLPLRYRDRIERRKELRDLAAAIEWRPDETACLAVSDGVVLARRPRDQEALIEVCLACPHVRMLLLEKPLAVTPKAAGHLLNALIGSDKVFRIGYIFRETAWSPPLWDRWRALASGDHVTFDWSFRAHHFEQEVDTWKRNPEEGGGPIRFYGIHVIAWLSELGYKDVLSSSQACICGEPYLWEARFAGPSLPICDVRLNCRANERFDVTSDGIGPLLTLPGPFAEEEPPPGGLDVRVGPLGRLCLSLAENDPSLYAVYWRTIELWTEVERATWLSGAAPKHAG